MSWKNIKQHYRIDHTVQITEGQIWIGSHYIPDLIVLSLDGDILTAPERTRNAALRRIEDEMRADPEKLRELAQAPDTFETSIRVYTYKGAEILEKQCEVLGWPNITHDGLLMYENTFSADREQVIKWAKRNCIAGIELTIEREQETIEKLAEIRKRLEKLKAEASALGITEIPTKRNRA